jgi:hypothetical protein
MKLDIINNETSRINTANNSRPFRNIADNDYAINYERLCTGT